MSIHFYRDDGGAVGEPDTRNAHADACDDAARTIELRAGEMQRTAERIEDLCGLARDNFRDEADHYTRYHAAEWSTMLDEAARLADALHALRQKMERA